MKEVEKVLKMTNELMTAFTTMFKAIPAAVLDGSDKNMSVLECARAGFLVVRDRRPVAVPEQVFHIVKQAYGADTSGFNATFHKSFGTVADMSPEEYFFHQILYLLAVHQQPHEGAGTALRSVLRQFRGRAGAFAGSDRETRCDR